VCVQFTPARDEQVAFIETHSLREIPEERMAAAFAASADPGTKACVIKMIAGGDLEGYRGQARATLTFDVWDRLGRITARSPLSTGNLTPPFPLPSPLMGEAIPDATVHILQGQGHFPHARGPERFDPLWQALCGSRRPRPLAQRL